MISRAADSTASLVLANKLSKTWASIPLGDLCLIKGGGTPSKKIAEYYSGSIPWVTVKDFTAPIIHDTQDHITEKAVAESATNLIPSGTVLVVTRVGLGKVAITGRDMAVNQDVKALFPDERILPEYLFWFLVSKSDDIERMGTGATVKGITLGQLKGMVVPVPPQEEQRRIVDILKRADGIRRLRKQAQDTARQLIPALFIDMFGDPATNPKGWPIGTIGDCITQAQYGASKKAHEHDSGLPIIRMGNVLTNGDLDLQNLKYVKLDEKDQAKYQLETGDILFNRTNSKDLVGKTGMWKGDFEAVAASYFIVARTDRNKILPTYLWIYMNTPYMKRRLFDTARGAIGQSNINAKELKALTIPIPPIELQERFEVRHEVIQSITVQQEAAQDSAESSFQSLLHRAFSGIL